MQLSGIWSDGMILQRRKPIELRGNARGNVVTVTFAGKVYQTQVTRNGGFLLELSPMEAGGPYEMVLYDGDRTVISDILIGEVWVLGGQSNMELPISRTLDVSRPYIENVNQDKIRVFQVPQKYSFGEEKSQIDEGMWRSVTPKTILSFSAAGYFLADYLYQAYQIPIGLIQAAVGGTPVEAWMSEKSLRKFGKYDACLDRNKDAKYVQDIIEEDTKRISEWHERKNREDIGLCEDSKNDCVIPGMWEETELEDFKGSVWFEKEFEVTSEWLNQEVELRLGAIVDGDETYINGILVGHTDYRYPPRVYKVAPKILKEGKNKIVVRVFSDAQAGGFIPGKPYELRLGNKRIPLEGRWRYQIGVKMEPLKSQVFFQYEPSGVFNGMIAPLRGMAVCGIAYYQGESNDNAPEGYADKMEAMISDWREVFGEETPVIYVQLPHFGEGKIEDKRQNWVMIREEQKKVLRVKNTAMITTIDLGEYNDLHPQNKREIGRRLSLAARKLIYHEDLQAYGPKLYEVNKTENKIVLSFREDYDGEKSSLQIRGELPIEVECLDEEENLIRAEVRIGLEKSQLEIESNELKKIAMVRYAWYNNPKKVNLFNDQKLPVEPFCVRVDEAQD